MTAAELAGGFALPAAATFPARSRSTTLRRLGALPEATQRLMLLAAADPAGDADAAVARRGSARASTTRRAARRRPSSCSRSAHVCGSGIRSCGRRPIGRAPPHERRAVHLALAAATDPQVDPDRRAWHLAAAAPGPDEDVAAELERSAGRAQARGGLAAAAAFLERSVALTARPGAAGRARAGRRAGQPARRRVRRGARPAGRPRRPARSTSSSAPGWTCCADRSRPRPSRGERGAGAAAPKAAKRLEPLDVRLARETYLDALGRRAVRGPSGQPAAACSRSPGRRGPPARATPARVRPTCCSTAWRR